MKQSQQHSWLLQSMPLALTLLLCPSPRGLLAWQADDHSQQPTYQNAYQRALEQEDYELAVKLAIAQFRPDLHCQVYVHRARLRLQEAASMSQAVQVDHASSTDPLSHIESALKDARDDLHIAGAKMQDYLEVGQDPAVFLVVKEQQEELATKLEQLEQELWNLRNQARAIATLLAQDLIATEDIEKLTSADRMIVGLHLADRGEFDRAVDECFVPLRVDSTPSILRAAEVASEILEQWHDPAGTNRKWDNLVQKGLDATAALMDEDKLYHDAAGWMLSLTAHLARDHYDVPISTIVETLKQIDEYGINGDNDPANQLLATKLEMERFLLHRRANRPDPSPPTITQHEQLMVHHAWWPAAELSLIRASTTPNPEVANTLLQNSQELIEKIHPRNEELARSIQKRLKRYYVSLLPFEQWLETAIEPDYRDQRGTVLPEILIETRQDLVHRVRSGFEQMIADAIEREDVDSAFQYAQRAKALSVGRITAPASEAELLSSNMMSQGIGGASRIPRQELFLEYFVGPSRMWLFYIFAPGDTFEPIQVRELDAKRWLTLCRKTVVAFRSGQQPDSLPTQWLLGDTLALEGLWQELDDWKTKNPLFRRVLMAPDGPLCFLPMPAGKGTLISQITIIPTAAILTDPESIDIRDVHLLWETHRDDLIPSPPQITQKGNELKMTLWKGATLSIHIQDRAE